MKQLMKLRGKQNDLYFWTNGDKDEEGAYEVFCPNCHKPITGNPIEYFDDMKQFYASFVRITKDGKEYKVLCCPDRSKCIHENEER